MKGLTMKDNKIKEDVDKTVEKIKELVKKEMYQRL